MRDLDYEQSLFFLSPSNKTPENAHARYWRCETGKARKKESLSFFFSGCRPSFSRLPALPLDARRSTLDAGCSLTHVDNWRKMRDRSQSMRDCAVLFCSVSQFWLLLMLCSFYFKTARTYWKRLHAHRQKTMGIVMNILGMQNAVKLANVVVSLKPNNSWFEVGDFWIVGIYTA